MFVKSVEKRGDHQTKHRFNIFQPYYPTKFYKLGNLGFYFPQNLSNIQSKHIQTQESTQDAQNLKHDSHCFHHVLSTNSNTRGVFQHVPTKQKGKQNAKIKPKGTQPKATPPAALSALGLVLGCSWSWPMSQK